MTTEKQTLTSADVGTLDELVRTFEEPPPPAPERKFYSAQARGFFSSYLHGEKVPADAVEISHEEWQALLQAQCEGHVIEPGADGQPVASPIVFSVETRARCKRVERDRLLTQTDGLVARHRDEMELGGPTTLTPDVYRALQGWRAALRNITQAPEFPDIDLPAKPAGL